MRMQVLRGFESLTLRHSGAIRNDERNNKMKKLMMIVSAGCVAALCGCSTNPVTFKASSAPVPPQGYTVTGSDVSAKSDQIWVLGLGGSMSQQQHEAFKTALGKANGADALVGMSIERHGFFFPPFFMMSSISVTGTPVKFNPLPVK